MGITVYSGGEFLKRCLGSVVDASGFDQLIVAYDGVDSELRSELLAFCREVGAQFFPHDRTFGYTATANQILSAAAGDIVVLLNSDTVVPRGWIERLLLPFADPSTGLVGPWSNAATFQSIPELPAMAGYTANDLPEALSVELVNAALICHCVATGPKVPALNGFCLAIRRSLIDAIGLFDAGAFPEGYGEELDYSVRSRAAGFSCRLANTLYVYHEKSMSFGRERRTLLSMEGKRTLVRLHGPDVVFELFSGLQTFAAHSSERRAAASLLMDLQRDGGSSLNLPPISTLCVTRWKDIRIAKESGRRLHYVISPEELDQVLGSPAGRAALFQSNVALRVCTSRHSAQELLRNTGLRAIVLPPLNDNAVSPSWFNAINGSDGGSAERG